MLAGWGHNVSAGFRFSKNQNFQKITENLFDSYAKVPQGTFSRAPKYKNSTPCCFCILVLLSSPLHEPFSRMNNNDSGTPARFARRPSASPTPDFFPPRHKKTANRGRYAEGALSHPCRSGRAHSSRVFHSGVLPPHV